MLLTRFLGARAACAWTGNVSGVVEFLVSIRYARPQISAVDGNQDFYLETKTTLTRYLLHSLENKIKIPLLSI